jgi:hypothetical protein
MNKEKLIHQVLTEKNIDLYNFWAVKLLNDYPEYKEKIRDNWWNCEDRDISEVKISENKSLYNGIDGNPFYYTYSKKLEDGCFLNWVLRQERYE